MSSESGSSINVGAKVSVAPIRSHSVLTVMLLVSVFPLLACLFFLWNKRPDFWIPLLMFLSIFVVVCVFWRRSQSSIDFVDANPTHISDGNGNKVITDSRTLDSPNAVAHIGVLLQTMGVRGELPNPDGLVNSHGVAIPGTKEKAIEIVDSINERVMSQKQALQDWMGFGGSKEIAASQEGVSEIENDISLELLSHNKADV